MDVSALVALGLLLVRVGTVVLTAPALGGMFAPPMVKIGLALVIVVALAPVVPLPGDLDLTGLAVIVAREVGIGLALGLAVRLVVAAAEMGGHLAGFQLGMGYAATVDPATGVRSNVVTAVYGNLALLLFLAIDGHHVLLRALARSYERIPVGLGTVGASMAGAVSGMLGTVFFVGVQLAAPVVVVMLLVELSLGLIERAAIGADIWALAPPSRVLIGLAALAGGMAVVPDIVSRLATHALELAMRLGLALR